MALEDGKVAKWSTESNSSTMLTKSSKNTSLDLQKDVKTKIGKIKRLKYHRAWLTENESCDS